MSIWQECSSIDLTGMPHNRFDKLTIARIEQITPARLIADENDLVIRRECDGSRLRIFARTGFSYLCNKRGDRPTGLCIPKFGDDARIIAARGDPFAVMRGSPHTTPTGTIRGSKTAHANQFVTG